MSEDFEKVLIKWDKDPGRLSMTHKIAQAMLNGHLLREMK